VKQEKITPTKESKKTKTRGTKESIKMQKRVPKCKRGAQIIVINGNGYPVQQIGRLDESSHLLSFVDHLESFSFDFTGFVCQKSTSLLT